MSAADSDATMAADEPLVELVDDAGGTIGTLPKLAAHRSPGTRHRAVSVFLLDGENNLLLQRRARSKYHSGGLWSNTCCGHPLPGEPPREAAVRRLRDEFGLDADPLLAAGTVGYQVTDQVSGLVEYEWNHLYVGRFGGTPRPDPAEIDDWRLVSLDEVTELAANEPFTAWFVVVFQAALPALKQLGER